MNTTRRQFLDIVLALGAGAGLLAACGDDGGGSDGGGGDGGSCSSASATIGTNHGHTLSVPAADVAAGTAQTYDITGTSPHNHTISVSAAQFATLAGGGTVNVGSSAGGGDGHNHEVTIRCA